MARTWKKDPTSWRTAPRPAGWKNIIVPAIKHRDGGRCTWIEGADDGGNWRMWADLRRCPAAGTDVDHMGAPDDHRLEVLRLLCGPHHDHRTSLQANTARWSKHRAQRQRQPERHPGLRHTQ